MLTATKEDLKSKTIKKIVSNLEDTSIEKP